MYKAMITFLVLIFVGVFDTQAQAKAFSNNRPIEIKLGREILGKVPTVEVVINGKTRIFYFDSGGGISGISPALAKEIGCEPQTLLSAFDAGGRRFDGKLCEDVTMNLSGYQIKRDVAVFDPMQFFPKSPVQLDGSIALDSFENQVLTMENEKSFRRRVKDMKPLMSRLSREGGGATLDFFVAAQTPKGRIWMLVDTGNTNKLLFRKSAQEQLGINFIGASGEKIIKPAKLDLIGLGTIEGEARDRDMIYDGMLSYDIIEKILWTVDLQTGRVWAKPNK